MHWSDSKIDNSIDFDMFVAFWNNAEMEAELELVCVFKQPELQLEVWLKWIPSCCERLVMGTMHMDVWEANQFQKEMDWCLFFMSFVIVVVHLIANAIEYLVRMV